MAQGSGQAEIRLSSAFRIIYVCIPITSYLDYGAAG